MSTQQARQPGGIPSGGQFAATAHAEPSVALAARIDDLHDADGTVWETDGDEYTDTLVTQLDGYVLKVASDIRGEEIFYTVTDVNGTGPRPAAQGYVTGTVEEAKAAAKADRARIHGYGHNVLNVGAKGMRGNITASTEISPGIDSVHTEHHGYYVLTQGRNREVDPIWRVGSAWYEGDCAWSIPVITHHRDLNLSLVRRAHEEARRYYPEQYDAVVGKDPARYGVTDYKPAVTAEG